MIGVSDCNELLAVVALGCYLGRRWFVTDRLLFVLFLIRGAYLIGQNKQKGGAMQDMLAQLEKLRRDAAECELIRDLATDPKKRELFDRLAAHLSVLAV